MFLISASLRIHVVNRQLPHLVRNYSSSPFFLKVECTYSIDVNHPWDVPIGAQGLPTAKAMIPLQGSKNEMLCQLFFPWHRPQREALATTRRASGARTALLSSQVKASKVSILKLCFNRLHHTSLKVYVALLFGCIFQDSYENNFWFLYGRNDFPPV